MSENYTLEKLMALTEKKNQIIASWKNNPCVNKIKNETEKQTLCYLLENIKNVSLPPCNGAEVFYEKNKFLITSLIWHNIASKKIVGFQPFLEDEGKIYYTKHVTEKTLDPYSEFLTKSVIDSEIIKTQKQQYKAVLNFEAIKDLKSVNGIDAETELCYVIAQEIAMQIDRWIFKKLLDGVATVTNWDFNSALGNTIIEKYESLYVKLVEVSNVIYRKCLAAGANCIVTSPEISSIFETATAGFAPSLEDEFGANLTTSYVGTINNRWKLYKDPLFQPNQILMGYVGNSSASRGMVVGAKTLFEVGGKPREGDFSVTHPLHGNFDMKFVPGGEKYFARIAITNFII